jgi:hypothetical protein
VSLGNHRSKTGNFVATLKKLFEENCLSQTRIVCYKHTRVCLKQA